MEKVKKEFRDYVKDEEIIKIIKTKFQCEVQLEFPCYDSPFSHFQDENVRLLKRQFCNQYVIVRNHKQVKTSLPQVIIEFFYSNSSEIEEIERDYLNSMLEFRVDNETIKIIIACIN